MARSFKVAAVAVVAVLALGMLAATAFAADPTPAQTPPTPPFGTPPFGFMGGPGIGFLGISDAVLNLLGMTREQIQTERQAGKSLVQIAQAKGVSEQKLIDTIVAAQKAALDKLVQSGRITQAQETSILQFMQTRVKAAVEATATFGPGFGPGLRAGGAGGFGPGHGPRGGRFGGFAPGQAPGAAGFGPWGGNPPSWAPIS